MGEYYEDLSKAAATAKVSVPNGDNHAAYYTRVLRVNKLKIHTQLLKGFKANELLGNAPSVRDVTALANNLDEFKEWQRVFDAGTKVWDDQYSPGNTWGLPDADFQAALANLKADADRAGAAIRRRR